MRRSTRSHSVTATATERSTSTTIFTAFLVSVTCLVSSENRLVPRQSLSLGQRAVETERVNTSVLLALV